MDAYRIDDHKLMFHVHRVAKWLDGDLVYPIYVEISPSGRATTAARFAPWISWDIKQDFWTQKCCPPQ